MGEPEPGTVHEYAFHPNVASWIQSTSLAAQFDGSSDEPAQPAPDDFYKAIPRHYQDAPATLTEDMAATRQRQPAPSSSTTARPAFRSASGPASSLSATRTTPQLPGNRPTVKSLAQKFNQPSSTETSPSASRVRVARRPVAESSSTSSSPARQNTAQTYGPHKFNNLKPRERPQPAPALPSSARRANGVRRSVDEQASSHRRKVSSPIRTSSRSQSQQPVSGRQPFFGEVVGDLDALTPGYGIATLEPTLQDVLLDDENGTAKLVTADDNLSPQPLFSRQSPVRHKKSPNDVTMSSPNERHAALLVESPGTRGPRRISPPSRIPVATRRMSTASDSGSSARSLNLKGGFIRPVGRYNATNRTPGGSDNASSPRNKMAEPMTLPTSRYRDSRERARSPNGTNGGHSLAALITSSSQPPSPRLRHSSERQLPPQDSPDVRSPYSDTRLHQDYFQKEDRNSTHQESRTGMGQMHEPGDYFQMNDVSATIEEHASEDIDATVPGSVHERDRDPAAEPLNPHTTHLDMAIQEPQPLITSMSFDESPILGIPGSFLVTPPIVQDTRAVSAVSEPKEVDSRGEFATSSGELLQPRTFQAQARSQTADNSSLAPIQNAPSDISIGESIPIMLGGDEPEPQWQLPNGRSGHSPRLSIGAHKWRAEPLDASGTISFLEEDDSPTDPFANRDSLRPDDSASVAFYRGGLTLDKESYSVVYQVLNRYHSSDAITPEVAHDSKKQVQKVSPVIAQHKDWTSKESTETYLARLLSDANAADVDDRDEQAISSFDGADERRDDKTTPKSMGLSIQGLDEETDLPDAGTAIIYPSESRRYSRGSHASSATTIQEDGSRSDSFSGSTARDTLPNDSNTRLHPTAELRADSRAHERLSLHSYGVSPSSSLVEQQRLRQHQREQLGRDRDQGRPPPRPAYSPPPPPTQPLIARAQSATVYSPSVYSHHPQSNVVPPVPGFAPVPDTCLPAERWPLTERHHSYSGETSKASYTEGSSSSAIGSGSASGSTSRLVPPAESSQPPADMGGVFSRLTGLGQAPAAPAAPAELTPAQAETKRLQRRYRIMEELTHTEHMYSCDMMVVAEIFAATASEPFKDPKDRAALFGNSAEICKFSNNLWQELKTEIVDVVNQEDPPKPGEHRDEPYDEFVNCTTANDAEVHIGMVFKDNLGKLERLYTTYLLNHDAANKLIAANRQNPLFLGWQMACVQHCKDITDAWDLDSLLVKPVQRLLKYPLLIGELKNVTPPGHPDHETLEYCYKELLDISDRVNQAKKRQETLREATKEGKKEKKKGFGGMALVKALTSKTEKTKQPPPHPALKDGWSDWDYDKAAQKFGGHFFQLQIVLRDIEQYREDITACHLHLTILCLGFVQLIEAAPSSSPEIESAWRRTVMSLLELRNVLLEDHKKVVRERVWKRLHEVWSLSVKPGKLIEERKKKLPAYLKYRTALERGEKIDPKLEEAGKSFLGLNDTLKAELPKLYELTKMAVKSCLASFIQYQMDFWKNCQKKILPLLEFEPEHTTSFSHDMEAYVARYISDHSHVQAAFERLSVCNGNLLSEISNFTSPLQSVYTDDGSSRKSSSRRTESMGSDISLVDPRNRRSGGYHPQRGGPSFEGPPRSAPLGRDFTPPTTASYTQATRGYPSVREYTDTYAPIPRHERNRAISPASESSDTTVTPRRTHSSSGQFPSMDGAFDLEFNAPAAMASAFLSPSSSSASSHRGSAVFNSALPMSDSPAGSIRNGKAPAVTEADVTDTSADTEEPEVLFLAASLFEFNIAHDRREGGIPYLVYVPGEIFDVIGMKGELWLARNQDDGNKTVGWIWEKHFARILPEET